jgi:hypothetical protein
MGTSKNKLYRVNFFDQPLSSFTGGTAYADNPKQALEKVSKMNGYTEYDVKEWSANALTDGSAQVFFNHRFPNQYLVQVVCLSNRSEQIPKVYWMQVNNFKLY